MLCKTNYDYIHRVQLFADRQALYDLLLKLNSVVKYCNDNVSSITKTHWFIAAQNDDYLIFILVVCRWQSYACWCNAWRYQERYGKNKGFC